MTTTKARTILSYLQELVKDFGVVTIEPVSEYKKEWNKKHDDVKDLYTIKIVHKDTSIGKGFQEHDMFTLADIMPSKYSGFFYTVIKNDLLKGTNLHCGGYSECGNELKYDISWVRG